MNFKTAILIISLVFLTACKEGQTYTLYRDSPLGNSFDGKVDRIHIATFDTSDGEEYNKENCEIARDLFQSQQGVVSKFWCEKGNYKK